MNNIYSFQNSPMSGGDFWNPATATPPAPSGPQPNPYVPTPFGAPQQQQQPNPTFGKPMGQQGIEMPASNGYTVPDSASTPAWNYSGGGFPEKGTTTPFQDQPIPPFQPAPYDQISAFSGGFPEKGTTTPFQDQPITQFQPGPYRQISEVSGTGTTMLAPPGTWGVDPYTAPASTTVYNGAGRPSPVGAPTASIGAIGGLR